MFYRKEGQHSKLTLSCYLMQKQYDLIITCGSTELTEKYLHEHVVPKNGV